MRRLLVGTVLFAVLAAGYYFPDSLSAVPAVVSGKAVEPKGKSAESKAGRPAPAQLVLADLARAATVPIRVRAIGTVQPIATVIIKSRIDGQIDHVHLREGQEVKEGDLLFT